MKKKMIGQCFKRDDGADGSMYWLVQRKPTVNECGRNKHPETFLGTIVNFDPAGFGGAEISSEWPCDAKYLLNQTDGLVQINRAEFDNAFLKALLMISGGLKQ